MSLGSAGSAAWLPNGLACSRLRRNHVAASIGMAESVIAEAVETP
jgi:hypothetical protein